jgi:hypothetical protein
MEILIKHIYAKQGSKVFKIRIINNIEFRFVSLIELCSTAASIESILGLAICIGSQLVR